MVIQARVPECPLILIAVAYTARCEQHAVQAGVRPCAHIMQRQHDSAGAGTRPPLSLHVTCCPLLACALCDHMIAHVIIAQAREQHIEILCWALAQRPAMALP